MPNPRLPPDATSFPDEFADDDWWPPETTEDPDRPGESAPPPTVVALAGVDDPEGVRRVHGWAEPEQPRLLPMPVHPPPARRPRRLAPLAAAVVAVVLLGTAAVIAGVSQFDGSRDRPAPSPPTTGAPATPAPTVGTPTAGAVAPPGTPPGAVTLRDRRDNIALGWTYPPGAEGPVVISGGRSGQDPRAFQELPAGTTSWIVYGLDRTTDYCFTVAVVWSTDTVARARAVCTRRR